MALPKQPKPLQPDTPDAIQCTASSSTHLGHLRSPARGKGGRPSPRNGNSVRQTLLLSEETAERLAIACAQGQIRRRKRG